MMTLLLQTARARVSAAKTLVAAVRDRVSTVSPSHRPNTAVRLWAAISS